MKGRWDNDVTDRIGLDYVEIETKLLGSIWPSAFYDENQTGLRWKMKLSFYD